MDLYINSVRPLLNPKYDYLLLTRNGTQYKKLGDAMCKLVYSAIGKYIHPTRYRQIVETESASKLGLEDPKNISMDQKHSSQVARIYYQKHNSRRVAAEGRLSREKLATESRSNTDRLINSILFSRQQTFENCNSDLNKTSDIESNDFNDSSVLCAQESPKKSVSVEPKVSTQPPLHRSKRVSYSPEKDEFIRKGVKIHGFGHWTEIGRSFNFRVNRTADSFKVHIPPLTKFRPETPCGVKRSRAKSSGIGIVVFPQLSFFRFEKNQNYDVT